MNKQSECYPARFHQYRDFKDNFSIFFLCPALACVSSHHSLHLSLYYIHNFSAKKIHLYIKEVWQNSCFFLLKANENNIKKL